MRDTDHDELTPPSRGPMTPSERIAASLESIKESMETLVDGQRKLAERMDRMEADWGLAMNALIQVNLRMTQEEEAKRLQAILDARFPRGNHVSDDDTLPPGIPQ